VALPAAEYAATVRGFDWSGALIVAPPSAHQTPWTRKFGPQSTGFASGWMAIRGTRRRKAVDRGFVLSDHADWPGLLGAIAATGAQRVGVTHGYTAVLARWLQEQGVDAWVLPTRYEGEAAEEAVTGEQVNDVGSG
jgi:putative mRNA 3-end processing factor